MSVRNLLAIGFVLRDSVLLIGPKAIRQDLQDHQDHVGRFSAVSLSIQLIRSKCIAVCV